MSESQKTENSAIQTLIRLVSAGARGEDLSDLDADWQTVFHLATEQNVLALVACALHHSPDLSCPESLREYLLTTMRAGASTNLVRKQRILSLLSRLYSAGIQAKVLKGYAVAGCYRYPESRSSVDTDLLIPPHQEQEAIRILLELGFRVDPRASTSHHTVCQHPQYGMLELHVNLYSELIREVWFQNLDETLTPQKSFLKLQEPDGEFLTLEHTDQLIFLTLHLVKHFILEAATLRMMLDIALYFSANRSQIDAARFWAVMDKLRYRKLVSCILWNMVQFGGFRSGDFPGLSACSPEPSLHILDDMLTAGYLGTKEKAARHESGMAYNRLIQLKNKSRMQYLLYMLNHKLRGSVRLMFPPVELLHKRYPVIRKYKILIPFVRVHHLFSYILRKLRKGLRKQERQSDKDWIINKRIELFRSLDML